MTNCLSPSMIHGHLHPLWAHFSRQTTCTPQVFLPTPVDIFHRLKDPFYRQLCFVLPCEHSATPPELQISYFRPPSWLLSSFQCFKWGDFSQDAGELSWLPADLPHKHLSAQLQSNQQILPALLTPDIPFLDDAASGKAPQTLQPMWFTSYDLMSGFYWARDYHPSPFH